MSEMIDQTVTAQVRGGRVDVDGDLTERFDGVGRSEAMRVEQGQKGTIAKYGPVEFVRVGVLWSLTIGGYGLVGIGWRISWTRPEHG